MKLTLPPTNRIVAFAGPYISLATGAVSSWLLVHVQILGGLGLGQDKLAHGLAYGVTLGLGALLPHLGMQKWLDGHQQFTSDLYALVEQLDPSTRAKILEALPVAQGDALKAIGELVTPGERVPTADGEVDTSGDVEHENALVDVAAPALDDPPAASTLGNDAFHAPEGVDIGAEAQPAAPTDGAA